MSEVPTKAHLQLSDNCIDDIERSGISPKDINARPLTTAELSAVGYGMSGAVPDGYVIPYYTLEGKSEPYYRIKFVSTHTGQKYRGVSGENQRIYFPPQLPKLLAANPDYIIITEGEKKAACAVAHGFPCVGLGGVDSWRSRNLIFPDGIEMQKIANRNQIKAKLPSGDTHDIVRSETGITAVGFDELVNMIVARKMTVIICYDTDEGQVKFEVQRAAAALGYELRYRGIPIPRIRQLVLPTTRREQKMGLDDYLVARGSDYLVRGIKAVRSKRNAFPQHPAPQSYINSKLQKGRLSRKEVQDISLSLLMELESRGRRLRNINTGDSFYFDDTTHKLMPVILNDPKVSLHTTGFGQYLYQNYNISQADQKLIQWLATQYTGEPGVEETQTYKVLTRNPNKPAEIAFQLSDTHYILLNGHPDAPYKICENGEQGILFEQNQVEAVNPRDLSTRMDIEFDREPRMLWHDVIDNFNFTVDADTPISRMKANVEQSKVLAALLFYISPWLLRWSGTQLPVELIVGEAGSGKSSLYGLRQQIITGQPRLSNRTRDIRDWYAGITSRGGLYVLDNVKFTGSDKDYQQQLSDELCRLTTEPDPRVEMRKLYTTSEIASIPVSCTFAVTSVAHPFFNIDILQRAAIFSLQSLSSTGDHDAYWNQHQLERGGGRIGWLAHQLVAICRFLELAVHRGEWDNNFRAGHRLANYEQALMLMAKVFGTDFRWIPEALKLRTETQATETDWNLSGVKAFAEYWKEKHPEDYEHKDFGVKEITQWADTHDAFMKNQTITNPWKLGKYIKSNLAMIKSAIGLYESGSKANKIMYSLYRRQTKDS